MADLRPWLKLWKTAYADAELGRLSLQDIGRWTRLLLYIGLNGERGSITCRDGLELLSSCVRVRSARAVRDVLSRLPGVTVTDDEFPSSSVTVAFTKWKKYQEDNSKDRLVAWRQEQKERNANQSFHETPKARFKGPLGNGTRRDVDKTKDPLTPSQAGSNSRPTGANPRARGTNPRAINSDPFDTTPADADPSDPAHLRFNIPD